MYTLLSNCGCNKDGFSVGGQGRCVNTEVNNRCNIYTDENSCIAAIPFCGWEPPQGNGVSRLLSERVVTRPDISDTVIYDLMDLPREELISALDNDPMILGTHIYLKLMDGFYSTNNSYYAYSYSNGRYILVSITEEGLISTVEISSENLNRYFTINPSQSSPPPPPPPARPPLTPTRPSDAQITVNDVPLKSSNININLARSWGGLDSNERSQIGLRIYYIRSNNIINERLNYDFNTNSEYYLYSLNGQYYLVQLNNDYTKQSTNSFDSTISLNSLNSYFTITSPDAQINNLCDSRFDFTEGHDYYSMGQRDLSGDGQGRCCTSVQNLYDNHPEIIHNASPRVQTNLFNYNAGCINHGHTESDSSPSVMNTLNIIACQGIMDDVHCHNGGTLESSPCRCECPHGFTGTNCEKTCDEELPRILPILNLIFESGHRDLLNDQQYIDVDRYIKYCRQ